MKKWLLATAIIFLGIFFGLYINWKNQPEIGDDLSDRADDNMVYQYEETDQQSDVGEVEIAIPDEKVLDLPFTSQAPFGVWDGTHEDACEEASLLMAVHFLSGTKIESKDQAENEIKDMIKYEGSIGYGKSITLSQLGEVAKNRYQIENYQIRKDLNANDIKREIARNGIIIVGAAGKVLPNPNFQNGGPVYHMLVIKGYDEDEFITNDPGTRKGEGFRYRYDDLIGAVHDWESNDIYLGDKNYLIFTKAGAVK